MFKHNRRADIDTLRAIAVSAVIIFHLDPDFFPKGYLGVDLFFIILVFFTFSKWANLMFEDPDFVRFI